MNNYFIGKKEYFTGIGKILYEGPESDNPLAFKVYEPNKTIFGKTMAEHLRFAVAYWHSFCATGTDPFGNATMSFPWYSHDAMEMAYQKADAAFEFFTKLGVEYYTFHDVDIAPDSDSATEYEANYLAIAEYLKKLQLDTGVKLLWNTANLTGHPRYMNGAATNPEFNVLTRAAVQVKTCLDVNVMLEGLGYTFWGGREGYMSLLNTNTKLEMENMAKFLQVARDYGRNIGFKGSFYIEPKPMEPCKHQYDFDAATACAFIKLNALEEDFKCNIESNHATLAGHTFAHELQICVDNGLLGSIDANQGDPQNGWDTDEFPTNIYDATEAMLIILRNGGLGNGGLNFDAKLRRNSTDSDDLFIAHIGAMDTYALALITAEKIITDGKLEEFRNKRYQSYEAGTGKMFREGKLTLDELAKLGKEAKCSLISGKQELLNNLLNQYLFS